MSDNAFARLECVGFKRGRYLTVWYWEVRDVEL